MWSTKVNNYVKLVRFILIDNDISADVGDEFSRVNKKIALLSKAQQHIDSWARDIDSGMSTYSAMCIGVFMFNILLSFIFIAFPGGDDSRLAVIITMSIWASMSLFGLLGMLSSMARPNQVWNRAKAASFGAKVIQAVTRLGWVEFGVSGSIVTIVGHGQCWVSNLLQETSETQGQPSKAYLR